MADQTLPSDRAAERSADTTPRWMWVTVVVLVVAVVGVGALTLYVYSSREAALRSDPRVAYLQGVLRENPDDVALRAQLALVYQQTGHNDRALREYGRILREDERNLAALYNTGRIRMIEGDERRGEDAFRDVLKIAPAHAYAAAALGFHLEQEGRLDEIGAAVGPAAKAQPNVGDLQYLMGVALEEAGEHAEAVKYYERAVELVPDMDEAAEALKRLEAGQ